MADKATAGMRAAFVAIAACLWSLPANANLTETAKVRYETGDSQSGWQQANVTFLTGTELNERTRSIRYNGLKNYALILVGRAPLGQAKIAVVRMDDPSLMSCGEEFDSNCLPLTGKMKGPDQEERIWEICTGIACF